MAPDKASATERPAARSGAPVLSIIIPSYNRGRMTLDLLARLDTPGLLPFPFEVVVVDNASSDPVYDEVSCFKPEQYQFSYHRRPANLGAERNLAYGLRLGRGEFSTNLSDDDWFIADELSAIVAAMQADPTLMATFAAWNSVDPDNGEILEQPSFGDLTVDRASAGELAERMPSWSLWIPEHAVYRTDAVARSLYSMSISYYNFTTIRRLLMVGRVRFSSKPFYLLTAGAKDEATGEYRQSSSYGFNGWSALSRGYAAFVFWATGQRLFSVPDGDLQRPFLMFYRNAMYEAQHQGRMAEALALLDHIDSMTDAALVTDEYKVTLRFLGALDELRLAAQYLPGVTRLQLIGLEPNAEGVIRQAIGDAAPDLAITAAPIPVGLDSAGSVFLTMTDLARQQIIGLYALPPGFVFSLESLQRTFGF